MDITAKEVWNSFFDETLDEFMGDFSLIRDLAMILHIFKFKFIDARNNLSKLLRENQEQKKLIEKYERDLSNSVYRRNSGFDDSDITKITGLSKKYDDIIILTGNSPNSTNSKESSISLNATPQSSSSAKNFQDSYYNLSVDLLDDVFNQQLKEPEIDDVVHADEAIIDETIIEEQPSRKINKKNMSPKLNKKKSVSRARKSKITKSLTPEDEDCRTPMLKQDEFTIICETPDFLEDKVRRIPIKLLNSNNNLDRNVLKDKSNSPIENNINKIEINRKSEKRNLSHDDVTICDAASSQSLSDEEIDIEVMLDLLENSQNTPSKKLKKTAKENVCDRSYTSLPIKIEPGPKFYKHEPVRKKSEREKLPGWDCEECENYFRQAELDKDERKKIMNACSRHRSKCNPRTILTPKGYWNPEFTPTQDFFP